MAIRSSAPLKRPRSVLLAAFLLSVGVDAYWYRVVQTLCTAHCSQHSVLARAIYWMSSLILGLWLTGHGFSRGTFQSSFMRRFLVPLFFVKFFSVLTSVPVLLLDDAIHLIAVLAGRAPNASFLTSLWAAKSAFVIAFGAATVLIYGVVFGAYRYTVRRCDIVLPDLPSVFDGLKIAHISDLHCGSFLSKRSMLKGIDLLLEQKPDLVFFTGDLVNNKAEEAVPYLEALERIQAPLGVYSVLGNHDYGDYVNWSSETAKETNHLHMLRIHQKLGWRLLLNESHIITRGKASMAIIGVENWSAKAFAQHGKLDQACLGTSDASLKLLLSHDPTHWDAQVRVSQPEIDVTFSGHTHGFQMGVENRWFRWSPAQYLYKRWGGLYRQKEQYLYVNRGYGCIGYPGRIGIPPEITIVTLRKSS